MSCKFTYKGKEYTEAEILDVLSKDPAIISQYSIQEQRKGLDHSNEDLKTFERKVDKLKKAMDVEVVLDPSVETSRVLPKSDPRTKAAGKPVILINPDAIFKTTAIHEFGHIFVDSFPGGLQNPRMQRALKELEGTQLESQVRALYPDLTEEMFQKELITTAIGMEGSEIWDRKEHASSFERFKDWFFDFLLRAFGKERSEIQSLSKELLSGQVNEDIMTELSEQVQEERPAIIKKIRNQFRSKEEIAQEEALDKLETSIDRVYEETLNRIILVKDQLRPKTKEARRKQRGREEAGAPTRYGSVTKLAEALEKYEEADKRQGLVKYLKWIKGEISYMDKQLQKRKRNEEVTDDNIVKSINWNNTFSMVEDVANLIESMRRDEQISKGEHKVMRDIVANIKSERGKVETQLLEMSRHRYAVLMAQNDNKFKSKYKRDFEITYDELTDNGKKDHPLTKEEYVFKRMDETRQERFDEAYQYSLKLAERSNSDLKWHAGLLFSEKDANSRDIQVLSKLVDERERAISEFALGSATEFDKMNKKHRAEITSSINQKEKYKNMYKESSKSGDHYYTSEYLPEFYEERSEQLRNAHDADYYKEKYKDVSVDPKTLKYTVIGPDGKPVTRRLAFKGGKNINIPTPSEAGAVPMHITYKSKEQTVEISMMEAVARSEMQVWDNENTIDGKVRGKKVKVPAKKWEDPEWKILNDGSEKNNAKLEQLKFLKKKAKESDTLFKSNKSRLRKFNTQEWIKLPSVMKSDISRISEGQTKDLISHKLSALIKTQKDEFDEGNRLDENQEEVAVGDEKDTMRIFADVTNREKMRVPIPFRAKLDANDQSLDLHSMEMMENVNSKNYLEKTDLEQTFLVVLDVMKNRSTKEHAGPGKKRKVHALTGKDLVTDPKDGLSEETKKAMDILENRIYGIKNKESGKIAGVEVHKAAQTWLKYSGTIALLGNYANSIINLNMGTISNVMDAIGGDTFTLRDWKDATIEYWKDMKNIANDWGSNISTSKTNLMMSAFNVMGGKEYSNSRFEETTYFQTIFKTNSMRPIAKSGEHMMQAKVMYSVLKSIKAMNSKGQYLNEAGAVVQNKKEAAGLDRMIKFETISGKTQMVLHPSVEATSFTQPDGIMMEDARNQILLEARNLIKFKVIELHGLYDSDLQAAAQRHFWGKMAFFLRKWMIAGTLRRWRGLTSANKNTEDLREVDRFYSQDAKDNIEGYYTTAARYLLTTIPKAYKDMSFAIFRTKAGEMTPREAANIKKAITELGLLTLSWLGYLAMDEDDDDWKTVFARYVLRRQISEMSFFLYPPEAIKIAQTPTAAIGTVRNILSVMVQVMPNKITEEYEQGENKNVNKAWHKTQQLIPLMNIKDKQKFKDGLKFLNNMALN